MDHTEFLKWCISRDVLDDDFATRQFIDSFMHHSREYQKTRSNHVLIEGSKFRQELRKYRERLEAQKVLS